MAYEAYEAAKPILASPLGGMCEVVVDGQTGFLLAPGEHASWRERIIKLGQDPSLSRHLGEAGRSWLEREVSPQRWLDQFNVIAQTALTS